MIAGCGGDDGDSTASEQQPVLGAATEPPKTFVERLTKRLETTTAKSDCVPLDDISSRSFVRFDCPADPALRKSLRSFKLLGLEQYGPGAVADYKSGTAKDGAAILLFIAPNNYWGVSRFGIFTKPSTGTDDGDSREGYDTAIADYLAAVRDRDCKAFTDVKFTVDESEDVCKTLLPKTKELGKRLAANPETEPVYQGGNDTFGFYAVQTRKPKPQMWTVSTMKTDDPSRPYVVLDAAPSPTAAQQRSVRRQFKERLESDPAQVETSESRKAD